MTPEEESVGGVRHRVRATLTHVHAVRDRLDSPRTRRARRTAVAVCFGDATGVTLFCAVLSFYVLTWRVGVFITDGALFVALLDRVAAGHLSLGRAGELDALYPGMYHVGPAVYGRNYGQVVASLPAYWLVDVLGPRRFSWAVVVGWSGLVGAVVTRVAGHRGRSSRLALAAGVTVGVGALVVNAATFKPVTAGTAVVALQVTAMLAATGTAVLLYRLVARRSGATLGVLAGAAVAVATPVGFWATVPKRHAFTALLVTVAIYALARSREDVAASQRDGVSDRESPAVRLGRTGFRAVAYASAGLLAWIHAPLGFTLFLALAVVDLPTAPSNDVRTLAVVGAAFALSLVPFLLTNYLIAGNPVHPPRFLPGYHGPQSVPDAVLAGGGGAGTDGTPAVSGADPVGGGGTDTLPFGGLVPELGLDRFLPATLVTLLRGGLFEYVNGIAIAFTNPDRLSTVFLRWGRHGYDPDGVFFGNGTNLSVLESAPIAAAVAVAPLRYAIRRARAGNLLARFRDRNDDRDEVGREMSLTAVDAFALAFSVLLVALYLPRLPVRVMVTVRYLHPLFPLLVYAAARQRWLAEALDSHTGIALYGYEATVLLGTPLAVGALLVAPAVSKGTVFQTFGLVALAAAGLLAVCGLGSLADGFDQRASALAAGLAAGVGTVFLLLTAFVLMHYGTSALPFVDAVSGDVRFAILRYG